MALIGSLEQLLLSNKSQKVLVWLDCIPKQNEGIKKSCSEKGVFVLEQSSAKDLMKTLKQKRDWFVKNDKEVRILIDMYRFEEAKENLTAAIDLVEQLLLLSYEYSILLFTALDVDIIRMRKFKAVRVTKEFKALLSFAFFISEETGPTSGMFYELDANFLDVTSYSTEYLCHISYELMNDPVMASDGEVYEKKCIQKWVSASQRSPFNLLPIDTSFDLIPCGDLKKEISEAKSGKQPKNNQKITLS